MATLSLIERLLSAKYYGLNFSILMRNAKHPHLELNVPHEPGLRSGEAPFDHQVEEASTDLNSGSSFSPPNQE